jgi:PPP family 3-phenylpropionic acid transporter
MACYPYELETEGKLMKNRLIRAFYFFFFFSVAAMQFLNLYYNDLGLTTSQIGMLFAVGPLVMICCQPLWGFLTDFWNKPRLTLLITLLGSATSVLFYPLLIDFKQIMLLSIIYFFFASAIPPIADSTTLALLEDRNDYGKVRLWGALGYAVGVISIGRVLDFLGLSLIFIIHSSLLIIALFLVMNVPIKYEEKKRFKLHEAAGLFKNKTLLLFLAFSFLLQLTVHANNSFYSIYLTSLGASITIVGLGYLINSLFEIPLFAMSKKIINLYSYPMLLTVSAIIYSTRWIIVGVSDHIYVLVFTQVLLSLSFSIQYFVSVAYVDFLTPERYRATGQTIFGAVTFGLGGLIGNILAGYILNYIKIAEMYRISAVVALLCITFLWIKPKKRKNRNQTSLVKVSGSR